MKKNVLQKMLIFAILLLYILNMGCLCFANSDDSYFPIDPLTSPNINTDDEYAEGVKGMATGVIGVMMWVGYAVSLGMLLYIGIKYVTASADEKASLKGMLVKLFVGACIIFMSSTIVNVAIGIFSRS